MAEEMTAHSKSSKIELAIITARGGSVGLPGKNVLPLGGQPLIAWTIASAIVSNCFERIVVSTDDPGIADAAVAAGAEVPFMRPDSLASDTASSIEVVEHAISETGCTSSLALLQPTSPFRSARHIGSAVDRYWQMRPEALVSVCAAKPVEWTYTVDRMGFLARASKQDEAPGRRQDSPLAYQPNGALYIVESETLLRERTFIPDGSIAFEMGAVDSLDIDVREDFQLAEAVVAAGLRAIDQ